MDDRVSIAEAKAGFARLVSRAQHGETIIITRNGKPVACLGPMSAQQRVRFGDLKGIYLADDLSLPDDLIEEFYRKRS